MAASKLPLKIKVDIRDQFDAPDSAAKKAFAGVEETLGIKFVCNVEWDLLWNELEASFPEKAAFIPNVCGVLVSWCTVLAARLDNEERYQEWTDLLVERFQTTGAMRLRLQVSDDNRPTTSFANPSSLAINLPRKSPFSPARASSGFETDFENLFVTTKQDTSSARDATTSKDDEWAEIDEVGDAMSIRTTRRLTTTEADELPNVQTLPSPEILLRTTTPYILHVALQSRSKIVVQGTHEPSLQLLSEYLQRWSKRDHRDVRKARKPHPLNANLKVTNEKAQIPLLRTRLTESNFGAGLSHDALTIEPYDEQSQGRYVEVNVTGVLLFVESVLGYERVEGGGKGGGAGGGGVWEFRRERAFK